MQPRRLVLVRHAKTEQGSPDIRRALTGRGRRNAAEIGRWLAANDVVPDLAVVSPATRARQTWELAAAELPAAPEVRVDDRIYDNSVPALVAVVHDLADTATTVALVGHNPSMGELAHAERFPTAAIAVFVLAAGWSEFSEMEEPERMFTLT